MLLNNLKKLKEDMEKKGWTICSFIFRYKAIDYIVLVKRFIDSEKKIDKFAMVKLHFMKCNDLADELKTEANSQGLLIDAQTLRLYFGIEYKENLGDILRQFTQRLNGFIPTSVSEDISNIQKEAMVRSLSKSDSEDPSKIFCNRVRRNPEGEKRSPFNADKTKLLRRTLFNYFEEDLSISFCYCTEQSEENDDATILKNFAKRNNITR